MTGSATTPTTRTSPDEPGQIVPIRLVYNAHGFHGPSLDLELDGDRLVFHRSQGGYYSKLTAPLVVVPTGQQWEEFRRELDAIPVWSWKSSYSPRDHHVLDGVNWELDIRYVGRRRRTGGYHESPPGFERFERALARLLGLAELEGEPFESPARDSGDGRDGT